MPERFKEDMEVARQLCLKRGFQHRVGYGNKPAIINGEFDAR